MKLMLLTNAVTKKRQIVNLENVVSVSRITEEVDDFEWGGEDWTLIKLIYNNNEYTVAVTELPEDIYLDLESNYYIGHLGVKN